jgi:DNA-directed RNA polymerase subunit RPC12/RpoP
VFCHKCGATLYESIEDLKTSDEIIQSYEGKCPTCGKKLSYMPITIEIKPFLVTNQLNPFEPEKKREFAHKLRINVGEHMGELNKRKKERVQNGFLP